MIAVQNLLRAAAHNQPLTLTNEEVREVALTVMGMDDMIAAYVEEFGRALADALTGADEVEVEGEIIEDDQATELETNSSEGEIVDEDTDTERETGLGSEDERLDSSEEE